MKLRDKSFFLFSRKFFRYANYMREILFGLLVTIAGGGVLLSYLEKLRIDEAVYFAFITGLTVGYGDFAPQTFVGRIVCVVIAMIGTVFVGINVAIATSALSAVVEEKDVDDDRPIF